MDLLGIYYTSDFFFLEYVVYLMLTLELQRMHQSYDETVLIGRKLDIEVAEQLCADIKKYIDESTDGKTNNVTVKNLENWGILKRVEDKLVPTVAFDLFTSNSNRYMIKKSGQRHLRFHDMRHSCASLLLAHDVPMKEIQEWLGHSSYTVTANLYSHLEYNAKVNSAETISRALGRKDGRKDN